MSRKIVDISKRMISMMLVVFMLMGMVITTSTPVEAAYGGIPMHFMVPYTNGSGWAKYGSSNKPYLSPKAMNVDGYTYRDSNKSCSIAFTSALFVTPDSNHQVKLYLRPAVKHSATQFDSDTYSPSDFTYTNLMGDARVSFESYTYDGSRSESRLILSNAYIGDVIKVDYLSKVNEYVVIQYHLDAHIIVGDTDLLSTALTQWAGSTEIPLGASGVTIDEGGQAQLTWKYGGRVVNNHANLEVGTTDTNIASCYPDGTLIAHQPGTCGVVANFYTTLGKCQTYFYIEVKEVSDGILKVLLVDQTTEYFLNEPFDGQGYIAVVFETDNNNDGYYDVGYIELNQLTQDMIRGFDTSTVGTKTCSFDLSTGVSTYTISWQINVKDPKGVASMTVKNPTTEYEVNDSFDGRGTIEVVYNDGTTASIPLEASHLTGFNTGIAGTHTVTVKYKDGEATYDINVTDPNAIVSIIVKDQTTDFNLNEGFDNKGTIVATLASGGTTEIPLEQVYMSGFDTSTEGTKTVTVTLNGKTTTYDIVVTDNRVTGIEVSGTTNHYQLDNEFDGNGTITVTYANGTTKDIPLTNEYISGFDTSTEGTKTVTVTYQGKTDTFEITVGGQKVVISQTISGVTSDYFIGDSFDGQGSIHIEYSDGTSEDIAITDSMLENFDTSTPGDKTVTVTTPNGDQLTYEITVSDPKEIVDITISGVDTDYFVGDEFTGNGKVHIEYKDGTSEDINITDSMLSGFDTSTPGDKTVTVTTPNGDNAGDFTITVTPVEITGITVSGTTTDYWVNGEFDNQGTVRVEYNNGSHEDIPLTNSMLSGFDTSTPGDKTVTVTHNGKTDTFEITVSNPTITGATISGVTSDYFIGDSFDGQGFIHIEYSDGTSEDVTITEGMLENFDTSTPGDKTVTVTHNGQDYTFDITVKDIVVDSIKVSGVTEDYEVGDNFDGQGSIHVEYSNGTSEDIPITEGMLSGFDTSTPGDKTVTVTHNGKTDTFEITVTEGSSGGGGNPTVTGSTISGVTKDYEIGDSFDGQGFIHIEYSDGTSEDIPITDSMLSGFDTSTPGDKTITVTHNGQDYTFDITVTDPSGGGSGGNPGRPEVEDTSLSGIKDVYFVGDAFDGNGFLHIEYKDGTSENIKITDSMLSGFDTSAPGTVTVTVNHNNITETFDMTVKKPGVIGITVSGVTKEYYVGDSFDGQGSLRVKFENNTSEDIPITENMLTGFDTSTPGNKTVTIDYEGKTDSFDITVTEKPDTGVFVENVTVSGVVNNYFVGDEFIQQGTLHIEYSDGTSEDIAITEGMLENFDTSTAGNKTVTVKHGDAEAEFTISVKNIMISEMEVVGVTTEYELHDEFDNQGTIELTYNNGDEDSINLTKDKLVGFNTDTAGVKTVVVKYENSFDTYEITVIDKPIITSVNESNDGHYVEVNTESPKDSYIYGYSTSDDINTVNNWQLSNQFSPMANGEYYFFVKDTASGGESDSYEFNANNLIKVYKIKVYGATSVYAPGDSFDGIGMVRLYKNDNTSVEINLTQNMISNFDTSTVGNIDVTVTYVNEVGENITDEYGVIVTDVPLSPVDIEVTVENPDVWEKEKTIDVKATGTVYNIVMPDGSILDADEGTFITHSNDTYEFTANSTDNVSTDTGIAVIDKIDTVKPVVRAHYTDSTRSSITIVAMDNLSGVHTISDGTGVVYTVDQPGTKMATIDYRLASEYNLRTRSVSNVFEFQVSDYAGNINTLSFEVEDPLTITYHYDNNTVLHEGIYPGDSVVAIGYPIIESVELGEKEIVHWNTSSDGTGTAYTQGEFIEVTDDMDLYLILSDIDNSGSGDQGGSGDHTDNPTIYTITYKHLGTNIEDGECLVQLGDNHTISNYPSLGVLTDIKEIVCWNTSSDGTGTSYYPGDVIKNINSNIILYMILKNKDNIPANVYTVTIHDNNSGYGNRATDLEAGETFTIPNITVSSNLIFKGLSDSSNGDVKYQVGDQIVVNSDIDLYVITKNRNSNTGGSSSGGSSSGGSSSGGSSSGGSSSGGSSSGGNYTRNYKITIDSNSKDFITTDKTQATSNSNVYIDISNKVDGDYTIIVTDKNGNDIKVEFDKSNKPYFKMPKSDVVVAIKFIDNTECPRDNTCVISQYTDCETDSWYHDGLHYAISEDIMIGVGNDKFAPNMDSSRAMVTQILFNMSGANESDYTNTTVPFTDIDSNAWYIGALKWAVATGVVVGYDDNTFRPNDTITREQLVVMIHNYCKYNKVLNYNKDYSNYEFTGFNDVNSISDYAANSVKWAIDNGIIYGMGDGTLNPIGSTTRAQVATMIHNLSNKLD